MGGTNVAPFTANSRLVKSKLMARLRLMSAAPGVATPGAAGLVRGTRLVSSMGLAAVELVVGSAMAAPQ